MYGEKDVSHSYFRGDVSYQSNESSTSIVSSPTPTQPCRKIFFGSTLVCGGGPSPAYGAFNTYSIGWVHRGMELSGSTLTCYTAEAWSSTRPGKLEGCEIITCQLPNGWETLDISSGLPGTRVIKDITYASGDWHGVQSFSALKAAVVGASTYRTTSAVCTVTKFSGDVAGYSGNPDSLLTVVALQASRLLRNDLPIYDDKEIFGELAQQASENLLSTNVNVLEFLSDLRHPKDMAIKLTNLRKLKTWSSNFLAIDFGVLPTIRDIQSLVAAMNRHHHLDRNGFQCGYSSAVESVDISSDIHHTINRHLKLAVDRGDQVFDTLCQGLEDVGMLPTMENIWDLIPYSFAIDWLIGVGDFLSSVDARQRIARLNIRYVTRSRKEVCKLQLSPNAVIPLSGYIEQVQYHRWVSGQCPVPPLSLQQTVSDFDHWLESAALIIQRKH